MNIFQRLIVVIITSLITPSLVWAADEFPGIQLLMDKDQIREAGIEKLTPQELEALNRWLSRYLKGETHEIETEIRAEIKEQAARDRPEQKQKRSPKRILSRIDGEFRGWSDDTVFRLKNGQVWKQRYKSTLYYRAVDPEVEIRKNILGFYILHIIGTSFEVGVTRIK